MSRKLQVQISQPCHEDWDKMIPGDKGRFCDSCQKTVHDFTGMSDAQLIAFFKKPSTGSVCGRFYYDQLNRDFEIPRKRIPWVKYFFQIAFPAFLVTSKAKAQGEILRMKDTVKCELSKDLNKQLASIVPGQKTDSSKIFGSVIDAQGKPIPYASILIKGTQQGVSADQNGKFSIRNYENLQQMTLVVMCVGFDTKEIIVNRSGLKDHVVMMDIATLQGYVGLIRVKRKPAKSSKSLIQRIFKDTTFNFFNIYPNPVVAGASINIELRKSEPGEYKVDLVNMMGQNVYSSVHRFESKKEINSFNIPYTITGSYLLQLTNKKSGKKHAEKIVIQ